MCPQSLDGSSPFSNATQPSKNRERFATTCLARRQRHASAVAGDAAKRAPPGVEPLPSAARFRARPWASPVSGRRTRSPPSSSARSSENRNGSSRVLSCGASRERLRKRLEARRSARQWPAESNPVRPWAHASKKRIEARVYWKNKLPRNFAKADIYSGKPCSFIAIFSASLMNAS